MGMKKPLTSDSSMPCLLHIYSSTLHCFRAEDTVADQDDAQEDTLAEQSGQAIQLFAPHVHFSTSSTPSFTPRHPRKGFREM